MRRATLVLVALLSVMMSPARADNDPCAAVMCLSVNDKAPWECKGSIEGYFAIKEYFKPCKKCGHRFDPPQAAAKRYREVLAKCEGARPEDREKIHALYGQMENSPFDYVVTADSEDTTQKKENADELVTTIEREYYTCSGAAKSERWAGKIATPTARAKSIPNGTYATIQLNETSSVVVKAENGYLSWPLYDKDNLIAQYGFASYDNKTTINVRTKEVVDFKSTNVAYWHCTISDPSIFGY